VLNGKQTEKAKDRLEVLCENDRAGCLKGIWHSAGTGTPKRRFMYRPIYHERNELADKLATEATRDSEICYNKLLKSETEHQERETSVEKWQQLWDNTTKETTTKEFFPKIKDRLKMKITLTPTFTAMVTAHIKTSSYPHRFKIIDSPARPCDNGIQTVEHIIYECCKLNNERRNLIADISKEDQWPVTKSVLVNKYLKQIIHFTNSIEYENM
jgi:hypothetical protein